MPEKDFHVAELGLNRGRRLLAVLLLATPGLVFTFAVHEVERPLALAPVAPRETSTASPPPALHPTRPSTKRRPRWSVARSPLGTPKPTSSTPPPPTPDPPPPPPPPTADPPSLLEPAPARLVAEPSASEPAVVDEVAASEGNGEVIARAIAASKRAAIRACFESELKQTPTLRGSVLVELDLAPPDKVLDVRVSDDLERPAFTRCVADEMHRVRFAALDEALSVAVPYVMSPERK